MEEQVKQAFQPDVDAFPKELSDPLSPTKAATDPLFDPASVKLIETIKNLVKITK